CICYVHFFFQAEDGIRDRNVTGVQTCALPIWTGSCPGVCHKQTPVRYPTRLLCPPYQSTSPSHQTVAGSANTAARVRRRPPFLRSEERRVGKECRLRSRPGDKNKNKQKHTIQI